LLEEQFSRRAPLYVWTYLVLMSNQFKATCVHLFHSPLTNESRLDKETKTLIGRGIASELIVFGYAKPNQPRRESIAPGITYHRLAIARWSDFGVFLVTWLPLMRIPLALISALQFYFKSFLMTCVSRPKYIACHNLLLLPVAVAAKLICRARLVYVPHELETHRTGLSGLPLLLSKVIERLCVGFSSSIVVVCEPIKKWYQQHYPRIPVFVVPNIPLNPNPGTALPKTSKLRDHFKIPRDALIFLYQGLVSRGRGVEDLITVFKLAKPDRHLIIMGHGELSDYVRNEAAICPRIHFKESVPIEELLAWTSSADAGLFYNQRRMTLSYQYSLPNKFFEYAIGQLYLIVSSNFIEQSRLIREHRLGRSIPADNTELLAAVNGLTQEQIKTCLRESLGYRQAIGWQTYAPFYDKAYGIDSNTPSYPKS
jgi:glycosyltransferase involved in cell wall biosynthesis